jgi:O-antigen ligase
VAWGVCIFIYLFIILLLTGGQTAFISLLLTFSFFISKYLLGEKTRRASAVTLLIVFLSLGWVGLTILLQTNDLFGAIRGQNDYWERLILWNSAFSANSNIWVGVGTGDYLTVLNEYYRSHEMSEFAKKSLNAHNEFIHVFFSNGLIGLVALILVVSRPLYLAAQHRDVLTILLYFPFLLYGVTEVFLGRYQGVVFFSFAHQLSMSHLVTLDSRRFL